MSRRRATLSGREGVDLVVETAGTAPAVGQAVELCRPGGRVVLTGLPHEASQVEFFWVVRREISILGSMIYQDEFPEAMALLASGQVQGRRLLTHRFALDRIADAFEAHRAPDSIKVALIALAAGKPRVLPMKEIPRCNRALLALLAGVKK